MIWGMIGMIWGGILTLINSLMLLICLFWLWISGLSDGGLADLIVFCRCNQFPRIFNLSSANPSFAIVLPVFGAFGITSCVTPFKVPNSYQPLFQYKSYLICGSIISNLRLSSQHGTVSTTDRSLPAGDRGG